LKPRITIVGAGISSPDQITREGDAALRSSELVFFLLDLHPDLRRYLKSLKTTIVDLDPLYREGRIDTDVYDDITRVVVFAAAARSRTALLVPGHPRIYVTVTERIEERAAAMGLETVVLPGISSLDTMILQLGLEIGERGVQIFEANRFIEQRIAPDPRVPLFLLQPGAVGSSLLTHRTRSRPSRFTALCRALLRHYPRRHVCTILASQSRRDRPGRKIEVTIPELARRSGLLDHDTSLFIPPIGERK
jgi:precorrin-6B methylase 1